MEMNKKGGKEGGGKYVVSILDIWVLLVNLLRLLQHIFHVLQPRMRISKIFSSPGNYILKEDSKDE